MLKLFFPFAKEIVESSLTPSVALLEHPSGIIHSQWTTTDLQGHKMKQILLYGSLSVVFLDSTRVWLSCNCLRSKKPNFSSCAIISGFHKSSHIKGIN